MESFQGQPPIEDYSNKVILAPMGQLPFRLLAKDYGADIVYSEEIIGLKLRKAKRVEFDNSGIIDFVEEKDPTKRVFSTCARDHPNVLQLGVADAVSALEAATVVSRDVNGIDVNMGCPKHFSVQGGMGSALLSKPETITDILTTLKRNLNNSITCKIRLLETLPQTIDLLKIIEKTGVSAIAVHTRYLEILDLDNSRHIPERPRDPAHWDSMKLITAQSAVNVPLIVNGDVFKYSDIAKVKEETGFLFFKVSHSKGASSVMIARGALWNCSVFQKEPEEVTDVVKKYMKYCIDFDNHINNTKYTIMKMIEGLNPRMDYQFEAAVNQAKNYQTICKLWNCEEMLSNLKVRGPTSPVSVKKDLNPKPLKKLKIEEEPKEQK